MSSVSRPKSILLIYHFFHPDPVISARLFADLAVDLAAGGYAVTVFTGNRLIRSTEILPEREDWCGVEIKRFARPGFSQKSNFGRLFNSAILQIRWLLAFFRRRREFDAVIIGTDPQFGYMMFPFLRLMSRKVKLVHWAFDLYPEAILVNSPKWMKLLAGLTKPFIPWAYRRIDVMVDIGSCMRERLLRYRHRAACRTLTPWALTEPAQLPAPPADVRRELFGDAKLGLLYSGTVGYAHDLQPMIDLARECRRQQLDVAFCFAGYGNQYDEQTSQLTSEDTNIRLAGFTSEEGLEARLAAADIHMISLRSGWEGIVVPSKTFGAIAIGRPLLFSGPEQSCIANWCRAMRIGQVLSPDSRQEVIDWFCRLINSPEEMDLMKQEVFSIYARHFSKKAILDGWREVLS